MNMNRMSVSSKIMDFPLFSCTDNRIFGDTNIRLGPFKRSTRSIRIQITQKRAADGGLWVDFPDTQPRDMRLGVFRALAEGDQPVPESAAQAPIVRLAHVGFQAGDWHHVVMNWKNFDSGRRDAAASLHVDGRLIGELADREIAMKWDIRHTGIYVAVNYIGLLDELAVFRRSLIPAEIQLLRGKPDVLATLKANP